MGQFLNHTYYIVLNVRLTPKLIDDVNPSTIVEARMTVRAARRSGEVLQTPKVNYNLFLMIFLDILDQGNGMSTSNVGCLKTAFSPNLCSELSL